MEKQTVYVPEIVKSILGNGNLTGEFRPLDNRFVFTEEELKERDRKMFDQGWQQGFDATGQLPLNQ